MTFADVKELLSLITPFNIPDTKLLTLYEIAAARFAADAPSCTGTSAETEAEVYYIASLFSSGQGTSGVTAEHIDDYSINYGEGGQTKAYYTKYRDIVDRCNYSALIAGVSDGQRRADMLDDLNLDAADVLGDDGTDEDC